MIASYEYSGVGIQYSNVNDGQFSFNTVLFMMWADFFIYGFLAWYLDQVIPHEFGSTQHPLFFLNPRFWWPRGRPANFSEEHFVDALQDMPEFYDDAAGGEGEDAATRRSIEAIPPEMRQNAHVRIKNLRKRYPDGNLAVRDFSLSMLEGQITCLLGHNGAGKNLT
jgi:ABC-type multidrug transport system fused ATPase/permease subunit